MSWSKADQEEKEESIECDPMNKCQDAESKEGRWMQNALRDSSKHPGLTILHVVLLLLEAV